MFLSVICTRQHFCAFAVLFLMVQFLDSVLVFIVFFALFLAFTSIFVLGFSYLFVGWVLPFFTNHNDYHFHETGVGIGGSDFRFSSDMVLEVLSVFPVLHLVF